MCSIATFTGKARSGVFCLFVFHEKSLLDKARCDEEWAVHDHERTCGGDGDASGNGAGAADSEKLWRRRRLASARSFCFVLRRAPAAPCFRAEGRASWRRDLLRLQEREQDERRKDSSERSWAVDAYAYMNLYAGMRWRLAEQRVRSRGLPIGRRVCRLRLLLLEMAAVPSRFGLRLTSRTSRASLPACHSFFIVAAARKSIS